MESNFRKWWVILIQGILLIMLSFYVFNHPGATLVGMAFWMSLFILVAGVTGIIGWFVAEKQQRETYQLVWSIASALFGVLLLSRIGFAMDMFTNLLGFWMVLTGVWLTQNGWVGRNTGAMGWITLIAGVLSVVAGLMVIFNIGVGAIAVSTLVGLQLLLAGIGLIVLALVKHKLVSHVKDAAADLRERLT